MSSPQLPSRIEPCHLDDIPSSLSDAIVGLVAAGKHLGAKLDPKTAGSLAELVSIMNCFYSNLIEGHHTRPKDIERALANDLDTGPRRNLQLEARAHIRVQREIDTLFAKGQLGEPASCDFVRRLHREFYLDAPQEQLEVVGTSGRKIQMTPGKFRTSPEEDVVVGRHQPPSSAYVSSFMDYFESRYRLESMGAATKITAIATSHHRFNYIHPFPDGNGRVSRLMSHAMALKSGIGSHGLWSISRGLARGLRNRDEYKQMMDLADAPRAGDTDGRGTLSARALMDFVTWFCQVARDQVEFMTGLFEFDRLRRRLREYVTGPLAAGEAASDLADEVFLRGSISRGEASRITKRPERTAREALRKLLGAGLVASETPKGEIFLRFSSDSADFLFPRLFSPEQ